MNPFEIDTVKIEKEKAMQRYRRFKKAASVATTLQFCLAFLLFSWLFFRSSFYFPAAVELSRFIPRRLCTLVVNHHFGFLLGNLIIVTLFIKSGHSASHNRRSSTVARNDDDGFLIGQFTQHEMAPVSCAIALEEAVSDDRSIVLAVTESQSPAEREESALQITELEPKKYRRTRSDEFKPELNEKIQLRRSETEPRREIICSGDDSRRKKKKKQVEDLSNEEFQRKVEAFIERQQRFLREESLSMALRNRISA